MHLTGQSWATVSLVAVLAVLAGVFAQPVMLAGSALVGAWWLGMQYRFTREITKLPESLTVSQWSDRSSVRVGEQTPVTLGVRLEESVSLSMTVDAGVPTAATGTQLSVELEPDEREGERTEALAWPVAGRHQFDLATVTVTNGFFLERFPVGGTPTVTVEPVGPRRVHVGEGGDRFAIASGEHRSGGLGSGYEPAELREYQPTDSAARIDWKATARLATPHVRAFEAETNRRTLFVVDHRSTLATGPPGETKLDYLREIALAMADTVSTHSDPVGLLTIGDDGITDRLEISTGPEQHKLVRRSLLEIEATSENTGADNLSSSASGSWWGAHRVTTQTVRRARNRLEANGNGGDERRWDSNDVFAERLLPFYRARVPSQTRIESEPLFRALRAELSREPGTAWTVVLTDDSNRTELHEAVTLARSNGNDVLVLLAPTVLFESGGLTQIERTYDRYRTFETYRQSLASMDGVTALEVGPGDRLSSILAAGARRGVAR
ncbi:DUF58 domain-containing protein [Halobacteria archaeon AArc-curdl1]|uniref:DUF58 domain-containing protein n=1 Tax=Natronosalvus hydrolyticus TaxID=2979988 RepID=A0AAP2ZB99_9EURY|nr:DUF58 domain-containing protein [Halobacteria archaeon AArc-curdl1]